MFELSSKVDLKSKLPISIESMMLFRSIMYHSGIPVEVITRFDKSNGKVIGEVLASAIANKLEESLVYLMQGMPVQRKAVFNNQIVVVMQPLMLKELASLKMLIEFCRHNAPFEVR